MMTWRVIQADVLAGLGRLADDSVQCVVTSPPYWALRDYGVAGQIGLEPTPEAYIERMVAVFREVRRVLRPDGTLWLNMGDGYAQGGRGAVGPKTTLTSTRPESAGAASRFAGRPRARLAHKQLIGMPWRLALALQADGAVDTRALAMIERVRAELLDEYEDRTPPDRVLNVLERLEREYVAAKGEGWWLRQDIIWHKPNPMPESVRDRCTKAHEYLFLLTKGPRYYFDAEAIREEARFAGREVRPYGKESRTRQVGDGINDRRTTRWLAEGLQVGAGRNKRSVWTIAAQPTKIAHFAAFPEKLVEPCIRAGTSAKGCCPACGAPWRRVVERHRQRTRPGATTKVPGKNSRMFQTHDPAHEAEAYKVERYELVAGNRDAGRHVTTTRTTGWEPTCGCGRPDVVPCVVLDPFCGTGRTGVVAVREGRDFVGIDLSEAYCGYAREAIRRAEGERRLFYG